MIKRSSAPQGALRFVRLSPSASNQRKDRGRARITRRTHDKGAYKTPTLRNVTVSAPYMHDGRFETLEAVLEHYRSVLSDTLFLDPRLRGPDGAPGIPISPDEERAIRAFLETLHDPSFLRDPALGAPDA